MVYTKRFLVSTADCGWYGTDLRFLITQTMSTVNFLMLEIKNSRPNVNGLIESICPDIQGGFSIMKL